MTNLLLNGEFAGNLREWNGTASIDRTRGYPRLGCAQLADGQTLTQAIGLGADSLYTLHYFFRLTQGAALMVSYGSVTQTYNSGLINTWRESVLAFALDESVGEELTFSASGATAYVDTVTLLPGELAVTRAQLASLIAASLSGLATDAELSLSPTGDLPEGDYTLAVDEALRALGCLGLYGDPDVTKLETSQVNDAVEAGRSAMLQTLRASYALQSDVTLGPRSESRSQIAESIDAMLGGSGGDRRVQSAPLQHKWWKR